MISKAAQPKRQDAPWQRKMEELIQSRKDRQMDFFFLVLVDRSSDTDTKSFYEAFRT